MKVREATAEDKAVWDAFVDTEGGNFFHYFDWKRVCETIGDQFIPILVEDDACRLVGILPVVRENRRLYSVLHSDTRGGGGLLLRDGLSDAEKQEAISLLLGHVDANYTNGCSRFELSENLSLAERLSEKPTAVLLDKGFRFRYDKLTHLPCKFVIELKQPFEEKIWKGLWSGKLRQELNRAKKRGMVVIQDRELVYFNVFIDMVAENCKRHGSDLPDKGEFEEILRVFGNKVKLFITLLDNQPIVTLLCYYHGSTCYLSHIGSYLKDTDDADKLCYAAAIEDACRAGYRFSDLSRTTTPGLAAFKERFKGTRVPFRSYEKRYSFLGTLMELVPMAFKRSWHDKSFLWDRRRELWDKAIHW